MEAGTLDMTTSVAVSAQRAEHMYLLPYSFGRTVALVRKKSDRATPSNAQQLLESDARVGVVRGFIYLPSYDKVREQLRGQGRLVEANNADDLFRMLQRGVVDAVFSGASAYSTHLNKEEIARHYDLLDWGGDEHVVGALGLSKARFSPEQAKRWDAVVEQLLREGLMVKAFAKFVSADQAEKLSYKGARLLK